MSPQRLWIKVSSIPWKNKIDKLFWRGSNAGKLQEYEYFGWNLPDLPRKHAVKNVSFIKILMLILDCTWRTFMKYKYHVVLAGNTYSSLFKHALDQVHVFSGRKSVCSVV